MNLIKNLRVSLRGLKKFRGMAEIDKLVNGLERVILHNRGTGAGGAKTNENGKKFEELTNNESRLISQGFTKTVLNKKNTFGYYLSKKESEKETIFVLQGGLAAYMKREYDIELFRHPDEAYIIKTDGKTVIKILEKKNQNGPGSVDTKLLASPSLKREYELVCGENFIIEYSLCLSEWFTQQKSDKYIYMDMILEENNIKVFHADENYFNTLDKWINQI